MSWTRSISLGLTLTAAGFAGLVGSPASADTAVLTPAADGTLFEPLPGNGLASSGSGQFLYSGKTNTLKLRRALVRFDFSSIPAGATITSVSLQVQLSRAVGGPRDMGLYLCAAPWGEGVSDGGDPGGRGASPETGDVTWDHSVFPTVLWAQPGGDYLPTARAVAVASSSSDPVVWESTPDLVADVQGWLDAPASNLGWLIRHVDEDASVTGKRFGSREHKDPAHRPQLTVEYTAGKTACIADFNGDDIVNSTDVSDFINQWFADQIEGTFLTDWDDNGVVNSTDVSNYINDWFASPPECTG